MRTLVVVLMPLLAGCSTPYATQSEIEAVSKPWGDCVWNAVTRMDDGKSDPLSVAFGIEPSCAVLYEQVTQAELKGMPETKEMQNYIRRTSKDNELKAITNAILIYRKSHAQQPSTVPSDATTNTLAAANEARKRNDFATELKLLRPLAEHGNALAQNNLGTMYLEGQAVPQDDAEALRWYRMAADQGNAMAQFTLGYIYSEGRGVPKDDAAAARWLRKSADQGNAMAQVTLGGMYHKGQGVPKDDVETARWLRKAADQGDDTAQEILGYMYRDGQGVSRDYIQADMWLKLAAAGGNKYGAKESANLEHLMTAEQIAKANRQVSEWQPVGSGK